MESKDMLGKGWIYTGDVNALDYGGKWIRQVGSRAFQVVELINMEDACGDASQGRYSVDLSLIGLDVIPPETIASALRSCGFSTGGAEEPLSDVAIAEACHGYGAKAPLDSWMGNNAHKMLREARKAANSYQRSAVLLASALDRPVNQIGSTAREYMTGDLDSAVHRALGGAAGSEAKIAAGIIQKMEDAATIPCPECKGLGDVLYGDETCPVCKGKGKVVQTLGGLKATL